MANENTVKEYKEERFEFALYVNDNLICKRNFKINNFIENSMNSINFKETVDSIVWSIDNDLKSKSRVYTWYYFNEDDILDEFKTPLLNPWECTFRFEITDNKKLVISKIWDGYAYPKAIRDKVDITNKFVRINTKEGKTYTYDKEDYFRDNADKLSAEMYVVKAMINDKPDLLFAITKKICENCSRHDDLYKSIDDYTTSETYPSHDVNGHVNGESKTYSYSINDINNKFIKGWEKAVADKTKQYFKNLY